MEVKDVIKQIKDNDYFVDHKCLKQTKLLKDDWLRVYEGGDCIIDKSIYTCDIKDIDNIPKKILNTKIDFMSVWLIGGTVSVDCIINTRDKRSDK